MSQTPCANALNVAVALIRPSINDKRKKGKHTKTEKKKEHSRRNQICLGIQLFSNANILLYCVCVHVDKNRTEMSGQKKRKSVSIAEQCQPMKGVLANFLAKDSLLFSLSNEKNKNSIKTGL